tara:strand:- start:148 stop:768 length:621 start_codon:yes stop_codon:yes gene_type:complete
MARTIFIRLHEESGFVDGLRFAVLKFDQRGMIDFLVEQTKEYKLEQYTDLAMRLYGREHTLYHVLFETSRVDQDLGDQFDRLQKLSPSDLVRFAEFVWRYLTSHLMISSPECIIPIILDFPIEPVSTKLGQDVLVKLRGVKFKPLLEVSGIIGGVHKSFENQLSRFRVFVHPQVKKLLPKEKKQEIVGLVKAASIEYLKEEGIRSI